jgi:hypothetical protein
MEGPVSAQLGPPLPVAVAHVPHNNAFHLGVPVYTRTQPTAIAVGRSTRVYYACPHMQCDLPRAGSTCLLSVVHYREIKTRAISRMAQGSYC